ncbi:MAG: energy transducer TonB [Candidatus Acidiferrum sp.]
MTSISCRFLFLFFFAALLPSHTPLLQEAAPMSEGQAEAYPNTSEGLQKLITEILRAIEVKDSEREKELIHSLLLPTNSTWFVEEYGAGFGTSLAAAYRRMEPELEQEILTIYQGNLERGWRLPKISRYTDPESVNYPIDTFLNCMNQIVPLYQTAFQGNSQSFWYSQKPGENRKQVAGDPGGFFIYDRGGFRFIPGEVLMKLPRQRPVRIRLDLELMESKLVVKVPVKVPVEAITKHISGRVVVQLILDIGGNIKESKVLEGNPILSAAVMDAVKQWRFAPTMLDGDPVEVELEIPMTFDMR